MPDTAAKNGSLAVANLGQNQWADAKVTLIGARAGQTAGLYFKVVDLTSDLSRFRLYFTSVARVNATYNALGPGGLRGVRADPRAQLPDFDRRRLRAARGRNRRRGHVRGARPQVEGRALRVPAHYIFDTLGLEPDLLQLGTPVTDEFGHQFTGLFTRRTSTGIRTRTSTT